MSRPRVCIYHPVDPSGDTHRSLSAHGCEVVLGSASDSAALARQRAGGAVALLGATYRAGRIDRDFLAALPALRIVAKYTIGVDDVDVAAASELGILVTHCPTETNWGGVAEGTLAAMLALLKKIRERDRQVKAGGWRDAALAGTYVGARSDGYAGLTIGLIGLGRTGGRVADLLAPWHVRLLACDPYVDAAKFALHNALPVGLEPLLEAADVVSLHCNLTAETHSLIGARELSRMKRSAILINTARGALVDIEALAVALEGEVIAGAALDVLPEEPPSPSSRLLALGDKLLLSPHMVAANDANPLRVATAWAHESVLEALRGRVPFRICNPEALPLWRRRFEGRSLLDEASPGDGPPPP
jgi:phosphoglycerate dehydrogenase-like enzyme